MKYVVYGIFFWVLLGAGFALDVKVLEAVHRAGLDAWLRGAWIHHVLKLPGYFPVTLAIAVVIAFWNRRAAATIALAGVLSGANWFFKWVFGRPRPDWRNGVASLDFSPFKDGIGGLIHQKALAFPSGHASLAFATAGALALWFPRWRWPAFALATIVGLERIAENAHHVSDVVAAAALGMLCAVVSKWLVERFWPNERSGISVTGDPLLQRAGERPDAPEAC